MQLVVSKFNSTGTDVLNFTYYGLTGATSLQGSTFLDIDLFPDGRVIAVGRTQGTVPVTGTAYQGVKGTTLNAGDVTGVIAVFDANLAGLLYSTYLGSADPDDDPRTWYGLSSQLGIMRTMSADRLREHHKLRPLSMQAGQTRQQPALKVTLHGSRVPRTTSGIGQHTSEALKSTMFFH